MNAVDIEKAKRFAETAAEFKTDLCSTTEYIFDFDKCKRNVFDLDILKCSSSGGIRKGSYHLKNIGSRPTIRTASFFRCAELSLESIKVTDIQSRRHLTESYSIRQAPH